MTACHRGHPRCDNRNNGNARTTSGATAKARVEADGLSAFCRFKSCPGARASEFLLASLICAGSAGGNPVCGVLSLPAPALIDTRQPTRRYARQADTIVYRNKIYGAPAPQREPLAGRENDMVRNSAGGMVFPVDDFTRLRRFLILGSEGGQLLCGGTPPDH